MMFKSKLLAVTGALVIAGSSFANIQEPPSCPSVDAIKVAGLSNAEEISHSIFVTFEFSQYDTDLNWLFLSGPFMAKDEEHALIQANKALRYLSGNPIAESDASDWICTYEIGSDLAAVAIQSNGMPVPHYKLQRLLNKKH